MEALRRMLGRQSGTASEPDLPPRPPTPQAPHHWLSLAVYRPGAHAPLPVAGARIVVRAFPRGQPRPGDVVARAVTGADGNASLMLPQGRYAVAAREGDETKAVTITLEHAGRATLLLESAIRRATLTVEVTDIRGAPLPDAPVDVRSVPGGQPAARAVTDADGVATIPLPPGAYEVQAGATGARTYLDADTTLRLCAAASAPVAPPPTRYAQKARAATAMVAPLDTERLREETWN